MCKYTQIPLIILLLLLLLTGCSTTKNQTPPSIIPAYKNAQIDPDINQIRLAALKDTATTLGAQGALAWSSQRINQMLERNQSNLDRTFNFRALLLANNVLPPVLAEGRKSLNLDSPDALRIADRVYKIESPPRFVTTPPNWRDYLMMNYQKPDKPDDSLLPKTGEERAVWNQYVAIGWSDGLQQADQIFSANLGRLKRDYNGMILYRVLLAQNMVTPPFVAKADLGVTGDDNEMRINDQVLRITATSKLLPNSKAWKPVLTPGN